MNVAPIDIAYEAGVPVVLLATRRAAAEIRPLAEDLIVAGAAVEVLAGVDHDLDAVDELLARVPEPRVLAVTRLAMERAPMRVCERCEALAGEQTRVVHCEIVPGLVRGAVGAIVEAMRGVQRDVAQEHLEGQALATVIADLRADGHDSCDDLPIVGSPPVVALPTAHAAVPAPRRRRRWLLAAVPAALATIVLLALSRGRGGSPDATPPPVASSQPRVVATEVPRTAFAVDATTVGAVDPQASRPEFEAQGPTGQAEVSVLATGTDAPATTAAAVDDALAQALARGRVRRVDDLIAYPLAGERDWYAAMTACRARAFWGTTGWRVPSVDELHGLARARLFAGAHVWSSTRAADRDFALVLALSGGVIETASKAAETREVICVLQLPEVKP